MYKLSEFKLYQKNDNTWVFHTTYKDGQFCSDGCVWFHKLLDGEMAITGDFGSWVFRRFFHPKMRERLSRGYFIEKVYNNESHMFDSKLLYKNIIEYIEQYFSDLLEDEDLTEEEIEGIHEIKANVDYSSFYYDSQGEYYYRFESALECNGINLQVEWESAPEWKAVNPWLENIMDVYDYIFDNKVEVIDQRANVSQ